ncbi:hypothetical protein [Actinoallomurus oryzae]|uniref:hypothetical protein n=1 Tax=Actinoallomurus oryzae TaxID=502180 RepID=UPI0031E9DD9B
MDADDYVRFAGEAIEYFRRREADTSEPTWTAGRRSAEAWMEVLNSGRRDPEAVSRLDELMRQGAGDSHRSWLALRVFYDHWRDDRRKITHLDSERIQAIAQPLLGSPAWGVALGIGSFLTLEFGDAVPPATPEGTTHGEWHLWVAMAAWRLESDTDVIVASEYPRLFIRRAIQVLNGLRLVGVSVQAPSLETTFLFEDLRLRLFPMYAAADAGFGDWLLWTPSGRVLTVGEGPVWTFQDGSAPTVVER